MKKVWILEKFEDTDTMRKHLDDYKSMASREGLPAEQAATLDNLVAAQEAILAEYPNGRWYGFEGKIIYRQFCDCAKAAIRRNPDGKFRVVEAEIEDDAKYWPGYKNAKVNEGVLKYLMATK